MKYLLQCVVFVWSSILWMPASEAFESGIFKELGKIKSVSIAVHEDVRKLPRDIIKMHNELTSDINGLIDTIIDGIQSGNNQVPEKDFLKINESLTKLQEKMNRNTINSSKNELMMAHQNELMMAHQNEVMMAHQNEGMMTFGIGRAIIPFIIDIPSIITQVESWVESWRNTKKNEERITKLETYKWTTIP